MERKLKRQQRTVGSIVKIPLDDGYHTYARVLEVRTAVYDCRTKIDLPVEEIVKSPVLFCVSVWDRIVTQGYWLKVGKVLPIEPHLLEWAKKPYYTEDTFTGKYTLYQGSTIRPATREEIIGVESFTIWDYRNIEDRINDHYANRFNQDVYDNLNGRQMTGMKEWSIRRQAEIMAEQEASVLQNT